jgi:hypothetical protein
VILYVHGGAYFFSSLGEFLIYPFSRILAVTDLDSYCRYPPLPNPATCEKGEDQGLIRDGPLPTED